MKLLTVRHGATIKAGWLDGEHLVVCDDGADADTAVRRLVETGGPAMERWRSAAHSDSAERLPMASVDVLAPIPVPRRDLFCVGKNYHAHAQEFHSSGFDSSGREAVPTHPVIFTKAMTSVVGPHAEVNASLDPTASVDYEGELGVVIGRRAFGVPAEKASDYVFGYTIINDVTSRELQRRHNQWVIGKGIDTFCPMGPWIITADEIDDIDSVRIETIINGEMRQQARLSDLIFGIPTLIETLTATMTLLPGDIIATGTPAGVGIGMDPPRYLSPGDRMTVRISGIGELENPVV